MELDSLLNVRKIVQMGTDVLVIGGGAAGSRAAIEAVKQGVKVIVLVKGKKFKTGSSFFPIVHTLGFQACLPDDPDDSPEGHLKEIIEVSEGMCDPKLSEILVNEAYRNVEFLQKAGVKFHKKDKTQGIRKPCFSKIARSFRLENLEAMSSVFCREVSNRNIKIIDGVCLFKLVTRDRECHGAIGISEKGEIVCINAKSVVLACGGGASIFRHNLCSRELMGDGYVMAIEAGAELFNMEFIQFIYGICGSVKYMFHQGLFTHYPKFLNSNRDEFIQGKIPREINYEKLLLQRSAHGPFTSRLESKYFDLAVYKEITSGLGTHLGGIYVKIPELKEIEKNVNLLPWISFLRKRDYDLSRNIFEITLHAHAFNGGVKIDENAKTCVDDLYAAGEVAAGPHGADRLGGNMMTGTQVFGARAGKNAALAAKKKLSYDIPKRVILDRIEKYCSTSKGKSDMSVDTIKNEISDLMWLKAGIERSEEGLIFAISEIERLERDVSSLSVRSVKELYEYLSMQSMIKVSKIVLRSAYLRKESRGCHYRDDFPDKDDVNYGNPILCSLQDGNIVHEMRRVA